MYIIIIGCGRTGGKLANMLSQKKHEVVVIEKNSVKFRNLSVEFSGYKIEGDALEHDLLEEAKIQQADMVVVTTGNDRINYFLAELASIQYEVPKIFVRIQDPGKNKMFDDIKNTEVINPLNLFMENLVSKIE